ncbi:MAG: class I SAM-dependent RNA methyltransferase [Bacteriovoracaceae bacterium]
MSSKRTIPFKISHLDSLGQGVSKETDKITFIPKTMTGDAGEAQIISEKKGVAFAQVVTFSKQSELRIEPICPHFNHCPSCHFLHIPYTEEVKIKKNSLERLFHKLPHPEIQIIESPKRASYRNRIQLHYDLKSKKLGMLDINQNQITPIPDCIIGIPEISQELKRLYQTWTSVAPQDVSKGHVEIYWHENTLKTSWNRPYAEGGFTQVFEEMNLKMKTRIESWFNNKSRSKVLDLFAGNGNLTEKLNYSDRLCVDIYSSPKSEEFSSINLYDKNALFRVKSELKKRKLEPDFLIIDPPRSGLKDFHLWLKEFRPQFVAYVSCDPHTLVRDLALVTDYHFQELMLFDFFPSTFHFETLIFLERKS